MTPYNTTTVRSEEFTILANMMQEGFARVDQRFEQQYKRFEKQDKRFEQQNQRFEQLDKKLDETINYMVREFSNVRTEIAQLSLSLTNQISSLRENLHSKIRDVKNDLKKDIKENTLAIKRNGDKIDYLFENRDKIYFRWHKILFAEMAGIALLICLLTEFIKWQFLS